MGYAARLNPRAFATGKPERPVLLARLQRFAEFFERRQDYDAYLTSAGVTDTERRFLESVLPEHLQAVHG